MPLAGLSQALLQLQDIRLREVKYNFYDPVPL